MNKWLLIVSDPFDGFEIVEIKVCNTKLQALMLSKKLLKEGKITEIQPFDKKS